MQIKKNKDKKKKSIIPFLGENTIFFYYDC
jgi:hypothetical protein